ncbi:MAG: hypothetical protein HZB92_00655 [Euryarchaeota archaeon]|nr:hypothetical protein [Euryarchaeota archaeon]
MEFEFAKESIIELDIYVDEIEPEDDCNFITLGALFIPCNKKDNLLVQLLNIRCQNEGNKHWNTSYEDCPNKANCRRDWHDMNNCEIHFSDIRDGRVNRSLINISKSWLNTFCKGKEIFINVLCVDLNKLDKSFFGNDTTNVNIYNKFFRTLINYGIKSFFSIYTRVQIRDIYYDEKNELERHYFFNTKNLDKISYESSEKITFSNRILFINSDHRVKGTSPNNAQFIQFIDLIIGSIRHNIFMTSQSQKKSEVARNIRSQLNKLRANYYDSKILRISFFPKNKIKQMTDLNNEKTYYRNDAYYYLDAFRFVMPEQNNTLEAYLR